MLLRLRSEVSDVDLMRLDDDNPGYKFEREEDGSLIVSPALTRGGAKSAEGLVQLYRYAKSHGGRAFNSSTGFAIGPDRACTNFGVAGLTDGCRSIDGCAMLERRQGTHVSECTIVTARAAADRIGATRLNC